MTNRTKTPTSKATNIPNFSGMTCQECGRKPDTGYFNEETGEILAVICQQCENAWNVALLSMSKDFCSEPDCADCAKNAAEIKRIQS